MAVYAALVFVSALLSVSQAAAASKLSIYNDPSCHKKSIIATIGCTDGSGSGNDNACVDFGKHAVGYTFKYKGTPLKLYYGAHCGGQPASFSNDISCTQVANAKSYKVRCNSKGGA